MSNVVYKTNGKQETYYIDGNNNKIPGETLEDGTLLYLRNTGCHLLEIGNVFELADKDVEDKYYVLLDANQVEFVEGNINAFRE